MTYYTIVHRRRKDLFLGRDGKHRPMPWLLDLPEHGVKVLTDLAADGKVIPEDWRVATCSVEVEPEEG